MDSITRMEQVIDAERDKIKRWAMRKILRNILIKMEETDHENIYR